MEFANGFVGAVVIYKRIDHHLLLFCREWAQSGQDGRLVDHLGRDLGWLRLVGIGTRLLCLSGKGVENAG